MAEEAYDLRKGERQGVKGGRAKSTVRKDPGGARSTRAEAAEGRANARKPMQMDERFTTRQRDCSGGPKFSGSVNGLSETRSHRKKELVDGNKLQNSPNELRHVGSTWN